MTAALALAERGLGDTWPNPSVGCVIVRDGIVVGRGRTQTGGRPHAETEALAFAGAAARGATAYVTLEPCSHHGKTPPCSDALVAAGVARVVAATGDPDPRVNGSGLAKLRAAQIAVDEGLLETEARALNRGYLLHAGEGRPLFTLKTATTLDARIATASGESKWITGAAARGVGQVLRARHDAILVGSETALADDPALTCRLDGYQGRPKVRVVIDRRLRLSPASQLATSAQAAPTWVLTTAEAAKARGAALAQLGVQVIEVGEAAEDAAFAQVCAKMLSARGLTRVLIEGGGRLAAAFLKAHLIDQLAWFRAATALGADARPGLGALDITRLADAPRFKRTGAMTLGSDTLELFDRTE